MTPVSVPTVPAGDVPDDGARISAVVRLALAPRWWPWHAALLAALVACGWLGWWQLASFEESRQGAGQPRSGPVAPLERVAEPGGRLEPDDVGRRVRAVGTWDLAGQVVVPGREGGTWVVTPLRVGDALLPVVRGAVRSPAAALAPPAGTVTVTGVLQRNETEADAAPGARLGGGRIPYVSTVTLLAVLPYRPADLYDGFLVLRSEAPPDPQAPAAVAAEERSAPAPVGRWRNLAYALQWWLFGLAAVAFWALVLRRAAREAARSSPDAPRAPLVAPRGRT